MNWWQVPHFGRLSTDSLCASAHPGGDNDEENEQRIEHHRNAHHRTSVHDAIPFPALLIICSLQPVEAAVSSSYVGRSLHVPVSRARRIRNEAGSRPAARFVLFNNCSRTLCPSRPCRRSIPLYSAANVPSIGTSLSDSPACRTNCSFPADPRTDRTVG